MAPLIESFALISANETKNIFSPEDTLGHSVNVHCFWTTLNGFQVKEFGKLHDPL